MPTSKPRLMVTLEPETFQLVRRLSELQGRPMGRLVAELVEQFEPGLRMMADATEALQRVDVDRRQQLLSELDRTERDLAPLVQQALHLSREMGGKLDLEPSTAREEIKRADDPRNPAERAASGASTRS